VSAENQKKTRLKTTVPELPAPNHENPWMRFLKTDGAALLVMLAATVIFYRPVLALQGPIWNDFIEQYFPYRIFASHALRHLSFPFWNPYSFSGMPFFADIQSAVLYPLNLLLVPFSGKQGLSPVVFEYQIVAHILLAGIFTYALVRDFDRSRTASLLAALVYMFGGFTTTHIFHVTMIHALPWFSCALLLLRRSLMRSSILYALGTGISLCCIAFAGHPQLYVYIHYLLGAYLVFHLVEHFRTGGKPKKALVPAVLFLLAIGSGGGLSAVQLLPTSRLGKESLRPEMEYTLSAQGSFRPYRFITLLAPNFFGTPNNCREKVPFYWGTTKKDVDPGSHYYWETALYLGVLPLIFALLALMVMRSSPPVIFLGVTALGTLFIAMGDATPVYKAAYVLLPGIKLFRNPARIGIIFTLVMAILSAFSADWMIERAPELTHAKKKKGLMVIGSAAACIILAAIGFSSGFFKTAVVAFILNNNRYGNPAEQMNAFATQTAYPYAAQQIWIFTLFALLTLAVIAGRLYARLSVRLFSVLLPVMIVIDTLAFGYGFSIIKADPAGIYKQNQLIRSIRQEYRNGLFRINSRGSIPGSDDIGGPYMLFRRNEGTVHEIFLMEGYNPLRLKRQLMDRKTPTLDILNIRYKINVDEATGQRGIVPHPTGLPRARLVFSYRVITDESAIMPLVHEEEFDHVNSVVLEEQPEGIPPGQQRTGNPSARIASYDCNRIVTETTAEQPSLLVLSEVYYPAWKATIDGKPAKVLRADYALRAIAVPAGSHRVVCYYDDADFNRGLLITLVTLAGMTAFSICLALKKKHTATGRPS
jgi:hypothetical protein